MKKTLILTPKNKTITSVNNKKKGTIILEKKKKSSGPNFPIYAKAKSKRNIA